MPCLREPLDLLSQSLPTLHQEEEEDPQLDIPVQEDPQDHHLDHQEDHHLALQDHLDHLDFQEDHQDHQAHRLEEEEVIRLDREIKEIFPALPIHFIVEEEDHLEEIHPILRL